MTRLLNRRRFLKISAAAGAGLALSGSGAAHTRWHGTALGADAQMVFAGCNPGEAEAAIDICRAEITRLEQVFSLYDSTSEISRLNRDGALPAPSADFLHLIRLACWFAGRTGGAFDCTVQPLWRQLAGHFGGDPNRPAPAPSQIRETLKAVDHRALKIAAGGVSLPVGSAITLNGIAQGYITDRVVGLLRQTGWRDVLVDLGEIRALPGRKWPVRLASNRLQTTISDRAIATSAGSGTPLNANGDWHHLIDPRTGMSPNHVRAATVVARDAVTADALSTALAVAAPAEFADIAGNFPDAVIYLQDYDGQIRRI